MQSPFSGPLIRWEGLGPKRGLKARYVEAWQESKEKWVKKLLKVTKHEGLKMEDWRFKLFGVQRGLD